MTAIAASVRRHPVAGAGVLGLVLGAVIGIAIGSAIALTLLPRTDGGPAAQTTIVVPVRPATTTERLSEHVLRENGAARVTIEASDYLHQHVLRENAGPAQVENRADLLREHMLRENSTP